MGYTVLVYVHLRVVYVVKAGLIGCPKATFGYHLLYSAYSLNALGIIQYKLASKTERPLYCLQATCHIEVLYRITILASEQSQTKKHSLCERLIVFI